MIVVILFTTTIVSFVYLENLSFNYESLFVEQYKDSETFANEFNSAIHETNYFINDFPRNIPDKLDYLYYIKTDGLENTNSGKYTKEFFLSFKDSSFIYENGEILLGENTAPTFITSFNTQEDITMYIAFTDEYLGSKQVNWETAREKLIPIVITIIASIIISLALIVYLIAVTGRKHEDESVHYSWIDKIYTELLLLALFTTLSIWLASIVELSYYPRYYNFQLNSIQVRNIIIIGLVTAVCTILCGAFLLSISRKIKGKIFLKHSITYSLFSKINDFIKSLLDGRRFSKNSLTKTLHQRQIIFIMVSFILVFFTFLFIAVPPLILLPPILEIALIYWYIKYNNETYEEINKGFDESIEEQMKSERLKIIVSDLFDLAKSTSGNIYLDFESIDFKKLIEQTIGDMEDNIEKSGLQIKTNLPEEPVNILSDGKKLYRVFQNIIDNALKYSLQGTRIFINLEVIDRKAVATIKNTASYEMDFTQEEIMERFSRADSSRTTEGSGLGLSIAESFTNVCGGEFDIDIDGDMFKVIISFELL